MYQIPEVTTPSKTALVLIENSTLGLMGLDHAYMGCYKTAFLKFVLFVCVILIPDMIGEAVLPLLIVYALWSLWDWLRITYNALSKSLSPVLCSDSPTFKQWVNQRDVIIAFWLSLMLNMVIFTIIFVFVWAILVSGSTNVYDSAAQSLKMEKYVPSYNQIKENLTL